MPNACQGNEIFCNNLLKKIEVMLNKKWYQVLFTSVFTLALLLTEKFVALFLWSWTSVISSYNHSYRMWLCFKRNSFNHYLVSNWCVILKSKSAFTCLSSTTKYLLGTIYLKCMNYVMKFSLFLGKANQLPL